MQGFKDLRSRRPQLAAQRRKDPPVTHRETQTLARLPTKVRVQRDVQRPRKLRGGPSGHQAQRPQIHPVRQRQQLQRIDSQRLRKLRDHARSGLVLASLPPRDALPPSNVDNPRQLNSVTRRPILGSVSMLVTDSMVRKGRFDAVALGLAIAGLVVVYGSWIAWMASLNRA